MHADQSSLFGGTASHITLRPCEVMDIDTKLAIEKEILGVYVSGHPLDPFKERFEKSRHTIGVLHNDDVKDEQKIIVGGIVDEYKEILTKKGKKMAFITLSDFTGSIEAVVFPKIFEKYREIIQPDSVVAVQATVSVRDGAKSILINGIRKLEK